MPRIRKTKKLVAFSPDLIKEGQVVFVRNFGLKQGIHDKYKDFYKAIIIDVYAGDDKWDFTVEFEDNTIDTGSVVGRLRWICCSRCMQEEDFMFEVLR